MSTVWLIEAIETLGATLGPREPADAELRATVAPLLAWIIDEFEASAHDHHGVNVIALITRNGARAAFLGDVTTGAPPQSLGRCGSSN